MSFRAWSDDLFSSATVPFPGIGEGQNNSLGATTSNLTTFVQNHLWTDSKGLLKTISWYGHDKTTGACTIKLFTAVIFPVSQ
jgi:hypothetical protein